MEEHKHKTTFVIEWGPFAYILIPFILKNAPIFLSKVVVVAVKEFIHKFLEEYLDD